MNSVVSSVTSWWGASENSEAEKESTNSESAAPPQTQPQQVQPSDSDTSAPSAEPTSEGNDENQSDINADLEEMSAKAIDAAKEWGTYLYSFGKTASKQVVATAKQLKDSMEEKTIIGDFRKEQDKFVTENRDKKNKSEAAVPPWVGYNEEETMKSQILALSQDKRNFLRNPPAGVQFQYDFSVSHPIAMAVLAEDPKLEEMRFELVPKQVKEEDFWRNYFYRVSLIKQSAQLTSLAHHTADNSRVPSIKSEDPTKVDSNETIGEDIPSEEPTTERPSETTDKGAPGTPLAKEASGQDEEMASSPAEPEFISDAFQDSEISEEDLKKEMQQLGMTGNEEKCTDQKQDIPEWERELQAELQEYEVVDDGNNIDDTDLEKELLQQLEAESTQPVS